MVSCFFFSFVQINLPKRTFFRLTLLIFFCVNFCSPSLRFSKQYFTRFILVLAFLFLQLSEAVVGLACFFLGDFGEKLFEIFFMFMKVMFSCDPIGQKRGCVEIFFVMFTIFYFHDED